VHILVSSGRLSVGWPFPAYERNTPCRLGIDREREGLLAEDHTSQGRNHKDFH